LRREFFKPLLRRSHGFAKMSPQPTHVGRTGRAPLKICDAGMYQQLISLWFYSKSEFKSLAAPTKFFTIVGMDLTWAAPSR